MKQLLTLSILLAVLLAAKCYPAKDVAERKAAEIQNPDAKPEDLLKLVMTAQPLVENQYHSRTRGQDESSEPVNTIKEELSALIQQLTDLSKESEATETEEDLENQDLFEGDIKLTPEQKAALQSNDATIENWRRRGKKWQRDNIPYVLDSGLSTRAKNAIYDSFNEYHAYTCLRFRPRTTETNYLRFYNGRGCWSYVGMLGGSYAAQDISIAGGCISLIPAHEIFHALGRWHEQSRPDRDNFVTIKLDNVREAHQNNFVKYRQSQVDPQEIPYDYDSIMHYGAYDFAKNRRVPVIIPSDSNISPNRLGQRHMLSPYDIMQVNIRYCPEYVARLRGGNHTWEGRIEVNIRGTWGTVCDDYFDINDAKVFCKFLGFPDATAAKEGSFFGQGNDTIWLDNLSCAGSESSPFHCPHSGFGVQNCKHDEDAGVQCTSPSVRLVGGNSTHEGRVEIFLHGEWGTVCDDDWTITDANVVCKQLGYSEGASAAHKSAHFGQGTGIIWLDDVQCTGSEEHLYDCTNAGAGIHNCGHEKDAGVTCLA